VKSAGLNSPAPVVIEEVRVDNKQAFGTADLKATLSIPAGYHHLNLHFTALTYVAPERTRFRFRLVGVDPGWVVAGENRTASYGKIPAGEYRFEVAAQKKDGAWAQAGAVTWLRIAPRYWETAWFRSLIAVALLGVAALFWFERAARERELNGLRQQITRDLHDDLGSNIGSIALLSEALQKPSARTSDSRHKLLQEINVIARETLEAMREAVWFVDPEKDSSEHLVAHLRQLAESMLKDMAYEFDAPEKTSISEMPLELKRGVVLIFKEALYNVVRHANASQVQIALKLEKGILSFRIRDNGAGFNLTEPTHGQGLKNMNYRAVKIGGRLNVTTVPGAGTEVHFEVKA
jgi:signal transduction histidine kinase